MRNHTKPKTSYCGGGTSLMSHKKRLINQVPQKLLCPACNKKTQTCVYEDTIMINYPLYCRKCDSITVVAVTKFIAEAICFMGVKKNPQNKGTKSVTTQPTTT